jgi:hypothetical protein
MPHEHDAPGDGAHHHDDNEGGQVTQLRLPW